MQRARWIALMLLLWCSAPGAQEPARVSLFSPQGEVRDVRQVRATFSEAMVPFGDPRASAAPFGVECSESGQGRWVDPRTWVYDFASDLPAGLRCSFRLR
nr:hypothetical protein [Desulfobacterales bacterium]